MNRWTLRTLILQCVVAGASTVGSLYWSLGLRWVPCDMCWYERISMYPIFMITAVALVRKDSQSFRYVLPLTMIGMLFSMWHTLEQLFPNSVSTSLVCLSPAACAIPEFIWFGWIVPPMLAFAGFLLIFLFAVIGRLHARPLMR